MSMVRLHLGCGQRYFEGYTNIDYPLTEHSVQKTSVADVQADLLKITYAAQSVDEIRLHHVFEHFPRAVAAAQLCRWNSWLKDGGELRIEVPDFARTAKAALGGWFSKGNNPHVALRHIFGSQEAHWAVHYQGYSEKTLTDFLQAFGFKAVQCLRNSWKGTYNIDIKATKSRSINSKEEFEKIARVYLSHFLVDQSESEILLLETWLADFRNHLLL
jgi:predicted SAM-dependent methyltransferase